MNRPKSITPTQADNIKAQLMGKYNVLTQLAIESGLRISDLLNLRVKDAQKKLTVYERKSRRKRTVELSDKLVKALQYISYPGRDDDFIFNSDRKHGAHIHRSTVHRRIKKASKTLGIDCSAHSMRKLYAQNVLRSTGSIEAVQRSLNHQKIDTTLTYLDMAPDGLPVARENSEFAPKIQSRSATAHLRGIIRKIGVVPPAGRSAPLWWSGSGGHTPREVKFARLRTTA